MHSLLSGVVLAGVLFGVRSVQGAIPPMITPGPSVEEIEFSIARQNPDAISLAQILLTAIPASLRQIAATNIPAVSSIIHDEFSQDHRPAWFNQLPKDIQAYLIKKFGPSIARPTPPPGPSGSGSANEGLSVTGSLRESSTVSSGEWSWATSAVTSWGASSNAATRTTETSGSSSFTTSVSSSYSTRSMTTPSSLRPSSSSHTSKPSSASTPTSIPDAPPVRTSGLTRTQKIGLGVGIPMGILSAAAIFFLCCFLLRRRRKKNIMGSIPPSSPGFIPRFAFQEKSAENIEHQTPLTRHLNPSTQDLDQNGLDWDDEGIDPMDGGGMHDPYTTNNAYPPTTPMSNPYTLNNNSYSTHDTGAGAVSYSNPGVPISIPINDPKPIHHTPNTGPGTGGNLRPDPTPIINSYYTHSSNRARGMRTSYTSLRSVAEVSEPDDHEDSPVLGRYTPAWSKEKSASARNLLVPTAAAATGAQIKRKPVGASSPPASIPTSPAALSATQALARQTMPSHSGSSSSGLALTTSTTNTSASSGLSLQTQVQNQNSKQPQQQESPISPVSPTSMPRVPSNPFSYDYIEDYGAEYYHSGYVDVEDGLYGNTSLSRYPEPGKTTPGSSSKRRGSREWPLKSVVGSVKGSTKGSTKGHRRKSSPLWDGIYEE